MGLGRTGAFLLTYVTRYASRSDAQLLSKWTAGASGGVSGNPQSKKSKISCNIRQQAAPCQSLLPTNAAAAAGYPDISPLRSTVAPMNPIFRLFGYRRPPHRFLEITICDLKSRW